MPFASNSASAASRMRRRWRSRCRWYVRGDEVGLEVGISDLMNVNRIVSSISYCFYEMITSPSQAVNANQPTEESKGSRNRICQTSYWDSIVPQVTPLFVDT